MADAYGQTYTNATGLKDSFLDKMRVVSAGKTPLFTKIATSSCVQRTHTWYYDTIPNASSNNASVEGAVDDTAITTDFSEGTNYTQIVKKLYAVSGSQEATSYKGIGNYLAYQKARAMKVAALDAEYAIEIGSSGVSGASATARQMKGLTYWATAQNTATGAATAFGSSTGQGVLDSVLKAIWDDGEEADTVLCSTTNKLYIDKWTNVNTRYQDASKTKLTQMISVYQGSFGTVEVMMSTMIGDTNVLAFDSKVLNVPYLRRFKSEMLAKTGDRYPFQVIGELTLEVRSPNATGAVILS